MKQNEILNLLELKKPTQTEKAHAKKLSEIFGLMASFKQSDFLTVKIEPANNFTFGSYSEAPNRWGNNRDITKKDLQKAGKIEMEAFRADLIQAIKVQMPFANKTTNQIRLYGLNTAKALFRKFISKF
jgi:hypothetical protein